MQTFGRRTIYSEYTEEKLLAGTLEEQAEKVRTILLSAIPIHDQNKTECMYLQNYYNGDQDIYYNKQKHTRTEIDNRTVENWAYAFVDFKKAFLLGKAIQYVNLGGEDNDEISLLNDFCRIAGKKSKDIDLYEDILVYGRGYRGIFTNTNKEEAEDLPFNIVNCDPARTEVVYSSKIGNERLFEFIESDMQYADRVINENGSIEDKIISYSDYTVYTKNYRFVFSAKAGNLVLIPEETRPNMIKKHLITESFIHRSRLSIIELGKDIFNDINYLESLDKDDMEQFVNAIMIFTNVKIDAKGLEMIKELGACVVNSTDQKKASVDLLQQRLKAGDTQVYYTRLVNSLHQILGVPLASDNGSIESGDTGKARITGQGYLSSGIRISNDETKFSDADLKSVDVMLAICKDKDNSGIKDLKLTKIQPQFQIDMSENMLVKTQSLQNLYDCQIPRKFANSIIGLFPDPNAVTAEQEKIYGKEGEEEEEETTDNTNPFAPSGKNGTKEDNGMSTNDKINKQNKDITKVIQNEIQGN